jgi:phosphatidylglycerophosphatase A
MGFFTAMMWVPGTALFIALGFVLFRLFDIIKPPPARRLEQVRGGYGVVLDDVMAGIYANIVLQVIRIIIR